MGEAGLEPDSERSRRLEAAPSISMLGGGMHGLQREEATSSSSTGFSSTSSTRWRLAAVGEQRVEDARTSSTAAVGCGAWRGSAVVANRGGARRSLLVVERRWSGREPFGGEMRVGVGDPCWAEAKCGARGQIFWASSALPSSEAQSELLSWAGLRDVSGRGGQGHIHTTQANKQEKVGWAEIF